MMGKRRIAVFAFGTRGDVLPVAVVVAALARADRGLSITFVTHEAHRNMEAHLARSGVARFIAVAAPPVVPGRAVVAAAESGIAHSSSSCTWEDDGEVKAALEVQVREDCIAAMDSVMGDGGDGCVIINLFALEGWHLAELYRVPCAVLAPYVVPYSAPSSFERRFRATHPLLYRRLKEAAPGEVGWDEVMHWMWPLFTDRWASWRTRRLHLSSCPLTDPVTDLPLLHDWPQASRLLYGFSPQVVECPAYWPKSVSVCGFWFAPLEWEGRDVDSEWTAPETKRNKLRRSSSPREVSLDLVDRHSSLLASSCKSTPAHLVSSIRLPEMEQCVDVVTEPQDSRKWTDFLDERACCRDDSQVEETSEENSLTDIFEENMRKANYKPPAKLWQFISDKEFSNVSEARDCRPIFVGLSSMGSMGFLERPDSILKVLEAVLEATNSSAILLTAGHPPLDLAVTEVCDEELQIQRLGGKRRRNLVREGLSCFNGRLFCYSGSVPYQWLLPRCSVAIHHGGSGTTAACLRASIPQIICPFVLDQFYWAERMTWLGVAPQPLTPQNLMPDISPPPSESLAEAVKLVKAVIQESLTLEVKRCAASLSAQIDVEDGTAMAVCILRSTLCV